MRRTVIVLLITLFATAAGAQRLTQTFTNVSMADALTAIAQMSQDYRVQFIYDELEDFTVTTTIEDKEVPSAIRQVIGFYPIVMTVDGQDIFVECVRKERSKVSGTLVDEHSDPIPLANVSLLSPTNSLNMNVSGEWHRDIVRGTAPHDQLSSYSLTAEVNYYVGDFSFSASLKTPERWLDDFQVSRKTPWCYRLSAMWNHGSWAVEVKANNLFLTKNRTVDDLHTSAYSYHSETRDRSDKQYATLKVVYSIDYGMKISKSSEYQHVQSGSAILK